jgi:hypothetical protein
MGDEVQMRNPNVENLLQLLRTVAPQQLQLRGVYARVSSDGTRLSLTYDQAESDPHDEIASVCRGIIVASDSPISISAPVIDPYVVAMPFVRFFNHGQECAAAIDESTAEVQLKLDGTLMILYCHRGRWCTATRSTPDADVICHDGTTYAQRFGALWRYGAFGDSLDQRVTYLFELIGPRNRHVVAHADDELVMLCAIDTATGAELPINALATQLGINVPQRWKFTSFDALRANLNDVDPSLIEGYVVVDAHGNRNKVKNPRFFAANGAVQLLDRSPRTALLAAIGDQFDDIVASNVLSDEIRSALSSLRSRVQAWAASGDSIIRDIQSAPKTRRELADAVRGISDPLLRAGAFTIIDRNMTTMQWVRENVTKPITSKRYLNAVLEAAGGYHIWEHEGLPTASGGCPGPYPDNG